MICDDDGDPFNGVREWWNTNGLHYATPRQHLFEQLHLAKDDASPMRVGKGQLLWIHRDPAQLAASRSIRRHLMSMSPAQALKTLLEVLSKHKTNQSLYSTMRV